MCTAAFRRSTRLSDVGAIDHPHAYFPAERSRFVYSQSLAMSIFSKLFPGTAKSEAEASLPATSAGVDGEEGRSVKRSTNDGQGARAPVREPQGNKAPPSASLPAARVGASTQIGLGPNRPPPVAAGSSGAVARSAAVGATRAAGGPSAAASAPSGANKALNAASGSTVVVVSHPEHGKTVAQRTRAAAAAGAAGGTLVASPVAAFGAPGAPGSNLPVAEKASPPPATDSQATRERPSSSARPPAPEMDKPNGGHTSIADTFERLLSSEVDAGFASLERAPGAPAAPGVAHTDFAEVRALFAQLAANYVRPVRDFVIDLRWSDATADWLPICDPAVRSLLRAAEKLELSELSAALQAFSAALLSARASDAGTIAGQMRSTLLERYEELSRLMPQAFALDLDRTQREAVILQSLLLQVPDVKKITLDKMYGAGLCTLEAMALATPADIVATTGIPEALAVRIVERFRIYHEQVRGTVPDTTRARERERIAELTLRLRREHEAYEQASESWSRDAAEKRKEFRKAREQTLLDIQVELARLGEVDRLGQLERLPFIGKLAQLESFLEDAQTKYVAQP